MVMIRSREGDAVELAIIEDISEEKRLALALAASEWRFARLSEMGVIGIFNETPDGTITDANDAFLSTIGYSRGDRLDAKTLVAPASEDAKRRANEQLRERGVCETYEVEYRRKDGATVSAIVGEVVGGEPGFLGFALDVTLIKQAERARARVLTELRESVLARDEFLYIAAHELRNPLTPLVVQLCNLRQHAAKGRAPIDPAWLARQLEPAERAAGRLAKLIERLLEVARAIVGGVPLELKTVDVVQIVHDVVKRMAPEIERAASHVTVKSNDVSVFGTWDSMRIEEVVCDLLENALKYGAGAPIEIEVRADALAARVSVTDHGIGISSENHARIFERFGRAAPLHQYAGFGLGLWMERRIVEAHGGRIELESEAGKGARFTVTLPRASRPQRAEQQKGMANDAHPGC
jgi:PAS domain S-box-containing protein